MGSNGRIIQSFGAAESAEVRRDLPATTFRKLAAAKNDEAVWAARINEYRIERSELTGHTLAEFVRPPAPFETWIKAQSPTLKDAPQARLLAIHADSAGLLWVLVRIPDRDWKKSLEPWKTAEGTFYRAKDEDKLYDTLLEVVDPVRKVVLASERLDVHILGFVEDGLTYSMSGLSASKVRVLVWRFRLSSR